MITIKRLFPRLVSYTRQSSSLPSALEEIIGDDDIKTDYNSTYKFMDKAQLEVNGGKGGNGCMSFEELTPGKKRPTGGNGGVGGNVYIVADRGLNGMSFNTFHINAGSGRNGGSEGLTGRNGNDVYVKVPLGTVVSERLSDSLQDLVDMGEEDWDEETIFPRVDLDTHNAILLVAEGGLPGLGNGMMSGTSTQRAKSLPETKMPGQLGAHKSLLLELKLIADIGLVGFPNAGKSTLLRALSNARPKVAPYPFTTLHPNIGVVEYSDLERRTVADIPGLVDGASENKGLGHDFLRHIERTKLLLFVLDGAGGDTLGGSGGREPAQDLKILRKELELYNSKLLGKPALVFANKSDLNSGKDSMRKLKAMVKKMKLEIFYGSAEKGEGIGALANELRRILDKNDMDEMKESQGKGVLEVNKDQRS